MLPLLCGIIPLAGLLFSSLIFSTQTFVKNAISRLSLPALEPTPDYFVDLRLPLSSSDFSLSSSSGIIIDVYYDPTPSSVLQPVHGPEMYTGLPFPSELPLPPSLWHVESVILLCVATMITSSLATLLMVKSLKTRAPAPNTAKAVPILDETNQWGYGVSVYFEEAPRVNILWTSDRQSICPASEVLCLVPERGQFLWADFSDAISALGFVKVSKENPHYMLGDEGIWYSEHLIMPWLEAHIRSGAIQMDDDTFQELDRLLAPPNYKPARDWGNATLDGGSYVHESSSVDDDDDDDGHRDENEGWSDEDDEDEDEDEDDMGDANTIPLPD